MLIPRLTALVIGRRLLLAMTITAAVIGVTIAVVVTADPKRATELLDGLAVPPAWELARTDVTRSPVVLPSRVDRYYLVDRDAERVAIDVRAMLTAAGWPVQGNEDEDCGPRGLYGAIFCGIRADRGHFLLFVAIWDRDRGLSPVYNAGDEKFFIRRPDRVVVRISLEY